MFNKVAVLFLLITTSMLNGMNPALLEQPSSSSNSSSSSSQRPDDVEQHLKNLLYLANPELLSPELLNLEWPKSEEARYMVNVMSVIGFYIGMRIPFDTYVAYPILRNNILTQAVAILMNRTPEWIRGYALACAALLTTPEHFKAFMDRLNNNERLNQQDVSLLLRDMNLLEVFFLFPPRTQEEINNRNSISPVLLFSAIHQGNLSALRILLRHKISIRRRLAQTNTTALHLAAEHNRPEALRELLNYDRHDIEAANTQGYTPLHVAITHNNLEAARVLLESGASVFMRTGDTNRQSAFELANMLPNNSHRMISLITQYMNHEVNARLQTQHTRLNPLFTRHMSVPIGLNFKHNGC